MHDFTKSERKKIRQLAELAWDRLLREELSRIGSSIAEMQAGRRSPFEINDEIREFYRGTSRELHNMYDNHAAFFTVCRAYRDQLLRDEDLQDASESVRENIRQLADIFRLEKTS